MKTRTTATKDSASRQAVRAMLASGMSVRQIAEAMQVSEEAVRKHRRAIQENTTRTPSHDGRGSRSSL